MTTIKLTNLFSSVASSDYPYNHQSYCLGEPGSKQCRVVIIPDNISDDERETFEMFLEAVEISPESLNNYGIASYKEDVFTWHSPVYMGLLKREDESLQMGLMIGFNFGESYQSIFVPVVCQEEEVTKGKKTVKKMVYSANGSVLKLEPILDEKKEKTGKFELSLEYITDDGDEYSFVFPFLIRKDGEFDADLIEGNWKSGTFEFCLREFGSGGASRFFIASNKAFTSSFENKTFPKSGVMLLCAEGQIKITEAGSHENITTTITQSQWKILGSSHPDLLIEHKNKQKEMETITLGEATDVQFTSADKNNEGYTWLLKKGYRSYDGLVLIHIVKPSDRNVKHTPVNTCTNISSRIAMKIVDYPNLVEIFESLAMPAPKQLSAAIYNDFTTATEVEYSGVTVDGEGIPVDADGIPF